MILTSKSPDFFPEAENLHNECGAYQLQAAIRAFGTGVPDIGELYHSEKHRARDWSLPWNMPKILSKYGVLSKMGFWVRPSFSPNLAAHLRADKPSLFVVNSIQGKGDLHWVSAWGFDPSTSEFLVYDSQRPASSEPFGNARYHANLLERHLPFLGTFAVTIGSS